jgi:hypothetical protein
LYQATLIEQILTIETNLTLLFKTRQISSWSFVSSFLFSLAA